MTEVKGKRFKQQAEADPRHHQPCGVRPGMCACGPSFNGSPVEDTGARVGITDPARTSENTRKRSP